MINSGSRKVQYDEKGPESKPVEKVLAIDPHHLQMITAIDLEGNVYTVPQPRWLRRIQEGIDRLQSRRDHHHRNEHRVDLEGGRHYHRPSRAWDHLNDRMQDELGRLERRKHHFVYSLANWLFRRYDAVVIGDYAPQGDEIPEPLPRRRLFNFSLLGRLRGVLHSLAERSGKRCIVIEEQDTSRTCHCCGYRLPEPMPPSRQEWQCPGCGTGHERHLNAARNLLRLGVQALDAEHVASLPVPRLVPVTTRRQIIFDGRHVVVC